MEMAKIYDEISKRTEENVKMTTGDYMGDDGLIYCGKCNTRKQSYIKNPFTGKMEAKYHMCNCMVARFEEEKKKEQQREFERRVKDLRRVGFKDAAMQNWTFEKDDKADERLTTAMHNYVGKFNEFLKSGQGLLLCGGVGTGKTFAAACVVNALIDKGVPCLMTNFSRLTNVISGLYDGKQEYIDNLNRFRLLVIDDLSVERSTEYVNEIVYSVIDSRYRAGLPMIITTNLTPEELKNTEDIRRQRIYDRILERCFPLVVDGKSRRRENLKNKYLDVKNMLGI